MFNHCASSFLALSLALFIVLFWHCPLQKLLLLLFSLLLSLLLLLMLSLLLLLLLKSKPLSGRHLFACLKLLLPCLGSFAVRQPLPWFSLSRRSFCQLIHLKFATKSFNVASLNLPKMDNYFNKLCKMPNKTCRHSLAASKLASSLSLSGCGCGCGGCLSKYFTYARSQFRHQLSAGRGRQQLRRRSCCTWNTTHNSQLNLPLAICHNPCLPPWRNGLTDLPRLLPTF